MSTIPIGHPDASSPDTSLTPPVLVGSTTSQPTPLPTAPPEIPIPSTENPISIPPLTILQPPIEGSLGPHVDPPPVASPSSSMETAPSSLSPVEKSVTSPGPTSSALVDLATLIFNIQSRYVSQDSVPKSPSPTCYASVNTAFTSAACDDSPDKICLSDSASEDDLVPISALQKGSSKRIFPLVKKWGPDPKNPVVPVRPFTHGLVGALQRIIGCPLTIDSALLWIVLVSFVLSSNPFSDLA
ncbi:hypothetical protein HAX54_039893 [Datura stramonium]|uniref:Uncharacterized protein n=1 Tax=Datura stramonium TaxID=4076 RepID=A0ABS8SJT6_DATST|nr:hypothetical protein [Datura stramonium]